MQAEPTIRRACLEDYEAVRRLFAGLDALHRDRLPWLFQEPATEARSPEFFRDTLSREDSGVFVADAGGIIGLAHGLLRTAPDLPLFVPQRWGVLDSLVVDPGWRRRGAGRLLAQAIERWALGQGAAWVEVSVYDFNDDARGFYEALGYLPLRAVLRKPRVDADGAE
jgi:GNAT superfamily N-acetyltransferase